MAKDVLCSILDLLMGVIDDAVAWKTEGEKKQSFPPPPRVQESHQDKTLLVQEEIKTHKSRDFLKIN